MKKVISKKEILEAIRLEPLSPGSFCIPKIGVSYSDVARKNACRVCAVGGVLRRALPKATIRDIEDTAYNLTKGPYYFVSRDEDYAQDKLVAIAQIEKNPLASLSLVFENLCEQHDTGYGDLHMPTVRKKLSAFVKKYFPKQIEVELPNV